MPRAFQNISETRKQELISDARYVVRKIVQAERPLKVCLVLPGSYKKYSEEEEDFFLNALKVLGAARIDVNLWGMKGVQYARPVATSVRVR